jgi:hypothetical protein
MKFEKQKHLTESGLILELEKAGIKGISKRLIGDWRRDGLLPNFDFNGRGLGKGLGRSESSWEYSKVIIEQAKWIYRMRSVGISFADLRLNLWILGFPIHPEDVKEAFLKPLVEQVNILEAAAHKLQQKCDRFDGIIEDVINDEVTEVVSNLISNTPEQLAMPSEVLEVIANLFLNPTYNLDEYNFSESFQALETWKEKIQAFNLEIFEDTDYNHENSHNTIQILYDFLNNANFIQQYFSVYTLEKAVRECKVEDLLEVQKDLCAIFRTFMSFVRAMKAIAPHIRVSSDSSATDGILPVLFYFAERLVLADISLRSSGFSEVINYFRENVLSQIESEMDKVFSEEIQSSAPAIGETLSQSFELIERKFTHFAAK